MANGDGYVRVFSGVDGSLIQHLAGESEDNYGFALRPGPSAHAGSLLIGAPGSDRVDLVDALTGALLFSLSHSTANGDSFGISLALLGDQTNDGVEEIAVGAPYNDQGASNSGSAFVFSGADGSVVSHTKGTEADQAFGWSVGPAGDYDYDGRDDMAVGSLGDDRGGWNSGSVTIVDGTGVVRETIFGKTHQAFGFSVDAFGDTNLNFRKEIVVGADIDNTNGQNAGVASASPVAGDAVHSGIRRRFERGGWRVLGDQRPGVHDDAVR